MTEKMTGCFCPVCDRMDGGKTESRMMDSQLGMNHKHSHSCTARGHKMSYDQLMALKPRMLKLSVTERQPGGTISQQFWIHSEALEALRTRFPSNLMTTICSLFTALADPATLVIEAEHMRELRTLGIHRGRDVVALAKSATSLTAQLEEMRGQQKQYEMIQRLLSMAGGGQALIGGQGASASDLTAALTGSLPAPQLPPRAPVVPFISPEAENLYYEPVTPGSFGDADLTQAGAPAGQVTAPTRNQVVKFGGNPAS